MNMHGIPPMDVARRTVILVDDGIATGGTVRAALKGLRKLGPARLILAVPVGPPDMLAKLGQECDELVCLAEPAPFFAVGAHYGHRSEEHTSELQSLMRISYAVFCLKKKKNKLSTITNNEYAKLTSE